MSDLEEDGRSPDRRRGGTLSSLFTSKFRRKSSRSFSLTLSSSANFSYPAHWNGDTMVLEQDIFHDVLAHNPSLIIQLGTRACSNFALELSLLKVHNKQDLADALLSISELQSPIRSCDLIGAGIVREIRESDFNKNTLFRGRTIANTLMGQYRQLIAKSFVRKIMAVIFKHLQTVEGSFEMDPLKACEEEGEGESLLSVIQKDHLPRLLMLLDVVREAIFAAKHDFPLQLTVICNILAKEVGHKFPEARMLGVINFIFLRFICVALAKPATFGLTDLYPDPDEISYLQMRRNERGLMLASKIVQGMMNEKSESIKEDWMLPMEPWVEETRPQMLSLLDEWIAPIDMAAMDELRMKSMSGRSADAGIENPFAEVERVMPLEDCHAAILKRIHKIESNNEARAEMMAEICAIDSKQHQAEVDVPVGSLLLSVLSSIRSHLGSKRTGRDDDYESAPVVPPAGSSGSGSPRPSTSAPAVSSPLSVAHSSPPPSPVTSNTSSCTDSPFCRRKVEGALFMTLLLHDRRMLEAIAGVLWKEPPAVKGPLTSALVHLFEVHSVHPVPTPLTTNDQESCLTTVDLICVFSEAEPVVAESITVNMIRLFAEYTASNFLKAIWEESVQKLSLSTNRFDIDAKKVPNPVSRASNARALATRVSAALDQIIANLNECPKPLWDIFHFLAVERQYIIAPIFTSAILSPVLADPSKFDLNVSSNAQASKKLLKQASAVIEKVANGTMYYTGDQAVKPLNTFISEQSEVFQNALQQWALSAAPTAVSQSHNFSEVAEQLAMHAIFEFVYDHRHGIVETLEDSTLEMRVEYRLQDIIRLLWKNPFADQGEPTGAEEGSE